MDYSEAKDATDSHSPDQWLPVLLLLVCRQRLRGADIRDRLVSDAGAVRRLLVGVDRRAAGNLHGRDVSRQLSSAAVHLAAAPSAQGLRTARDRHRRHRSVAAVRPAAGRARLHRRGAATVWPAICSAGSSRAFVFCRQRLRWAPRCRRLRDGCRPPRPACRGWDFFTRATSPARSWARCWRASICCAFTT